MFRKYCYGLAIVVLLSMSAAASENDGGVLIFGGTGRLGAPIVKLLVESGKAVTVFARPTSDRRPVERGRGCCGVPEPVVSHRSRRVGAARHAGNVL